MKCAACGYEYVACAKEEWRENDGHGGSYTVGPQPFKAYWPHGSVVAGQEPVVFCICPKCGTVRAE